MPDAAFAALTTERLALRRFRPEDLEAFVARAPGYGYATEAVRRPLSGVRRRTSQRIERGPHAPRRATHAS